MQSRGIAIFSAFLCIFALGIHGIPKISSNNLEILSKSMEKSKRMEVLIGFLPSSSFEAQKRGISIVSEEEEIALGWKSVEFELESINQQIKLRKRAIGGSSSQLNAIKVQKVFEFIPLAAVSVDSDGWNELRAMESIQYIEPNSLYKVFLQEANEITGSSKVWDPAFGGKAELDGRGYAVAVLDNGFNTQNPLLSSRVAGEACFIVSDNSSIVCPNGRNQMVGAGASQAPVNAIHGSHCAGIVGGNDPTSGLKGAAPGAGLVLINVFGQYNGVEVETASAGSIIAGLEFVYSNRNNLKFAAVSMSLGGGVSAGYCDSEVGAYVSIFKKLKLAGIAVVIASGNEYHKNGIAYPACVSEAISVGASTKGDLVASFSNSHRILSILAPGVFIYSATTQNGYGFLQGTSMACPMVAGSYAVLRSAFGDAPTVDSLTKRLQDTGKLITDRNGVTTPRLSVFAAISGKRWTCGDGTLDAGEQCDDGNNSAGDGCNNACMAEWGYNCNGSPSRCQLASVVDTDSSNRLLGNAESGNVGNWARDSEAYAGSYSYYAYNLARTDAVMGFSILVPAATMTETSGRRVILSFRLATIGDAAGNCPASLFVVANGVLIESTTNRYNSSTALSPLNRNQDAIYGSTYPGVRGFCQGQTNDNAWNLVEIDVTSFQGKFCSFQFIITSNRASEQTFQALVDEIYLRTTSSTVSNYNAPATSAVPVVGLTETALIRTVDVTRRNSSSLLAASITMILSIIALIA